MISLGSATTTAATKAFCTFDQIGFRLGAALLRSEHPRQQHRYPVAIPPILVAKK